MWRARLGYKRWGNITSRWTNLNQRWHRDREKRALSAGTEPGRNPAAGSVREEGPPDCLVRVCGSENHSELHPLRMGGGLERNSFSYLSSGLFLNVPQCVRPPFMVAKWKKQLAVPTCKGLSFYKWPWRKWECLGFLYSLNMWGEVSFIKCLWALEKFFKPVLLVIGIGTCNF